MTPVTLALVTWQLAASPAAATAPADSAAEIQQVVNRAVQVYQTARSYEDTLIARTEIDADPPLDAPDASEVPLAFERPNKIALQTELYRIASDGNKLTEWVEVWMQYAEGPAPQTLKLKDLQLNQFGFFRESKHPLLALVVEGDRASLDLLSDKAQLTAIRSEPLDGAPGKRITGVTGTSKNIPAEIWFDDATGLIGEIVYDHTKAAQASVPEMNLRKFVQRLRFKNARVNQPIRPERFAVKPDSYAEKVSALRMPSSQEMQQKLVGKPAVAFTGKYLDGKEASLADFKGRVLLLDFWSLRCGPCIMSMPTLQYVADKYADKPVSIVGVNLDGPSAAADVTQLLESRKITFKHLIATKPRLAEKYFVEGIPCTVLIDDKGIIQSVHLGMVNQRDLSYKIDRLLAGESLTGRP
ncbi:MAG TPA: TlpA disulfide reductase family protein [Phycisphaerae bacterium]|nr:TlpA disulfide reductase family protein [Phycisphaerae bacterium]HOQ84347.1 TlpA disulfide reductase family protein [Phycisphaerae bacterium]HPU25093.1 TlpA disulfide reductase family protein [Phycisphaerae bacterium]HPZ99059.1 TlpA disulfide reductase family protein [Phycisphaerae bacterium]HQE28151.1 TlpA disulfide reductase family protein [Phycisphaerae bacterium]